MNRIGTGDAVIGLAILALVAAALLPSYRARAFDRLVESAVADVDALRQAASRTRASSNAWPPAMPPGVVPVGASGVFPGDSALARDGYTLEWLLWERVEETLAPARPPALPVLDDDEAPQSMIPDAADAPPDSAAVEVVEVVRTGGAVVVHSGHPLLLAELLRHYGHDVSFVRDTTWTLLITEVPSG